MSEFLHWLNAMGSAFVVYALRMGVQSSLLILALTVVHLFLRKKVRAVVRYWIWLLVLVKLVLPPSLSSPTGVLYWVGDKLPEAPLIATVEKAQPADIPQAAREMSSGAVREVPIPVDSAPRQDAGVPSAAGKAVIPAPAARAALLTWPALALVGWLAVVAVMVVLLVQRAFFVRGLVLQSREAPEAMTDLLERCRRQIRVRAAVHLRLTSLSATPSVCGLVRPTILIPDRMLRQLNRQQLKSILLHELAHIQRGDLWVNLAQTLLQIVYVYHPLVWLANALIRKVREQAVDETVLAAMGEEAEDYPRTLLSVSKLAFDHPALSLRLVGVVESKKALTARIRHIVNRPFPRSAKLGFMGLVVVLVLAVVLLPMAKGRHGTQAISEDIARGAFSATLPNGISVELLSVCQYPVADQPWWHPNGTLLDDRGFEIPQVPEAKDYTRTFAVRLTGRPLRDVHLTWELSSHESGFYPMYEDPQRRTLRSVQAIVARFDEGVESADLKIGIAAGAWRFAAGGALPDRGASTNDSMVNKEVIWPEPTWRNGSVRVNATHLLGRDYDCRIVAHGTDGRVHEPQTCTNTGGTDMRLCRAEFDLVESQIKNFELQARPYEWVEFKGIRLTPELHENARAADQPSEHREIQTAIRDSQMAPAPVGIVADERGTPVPGARVLLYFRDSGWGLGNSIVDETLTDARGRFALTRLLTYKDGNGTTYTDHYLLFATHPDHALAWQVIVSGAEKEEYRLTMTEPVTQSFRVTDREGNPLPRACVWIYTAGRNDDPNPLLRPSFRIPEDIGLLTAATDELGQATVTNLPRTACSFYVSMPGYSNRWRRVGVPSQGQAHVEMTAAGTVTGRVLTRDGRPVSGAQIWFAADWNYWHFDYAITDETGLFIHDRLTARGGSWAGGGGNGQYKVTLRHPDFAAPEQIVQLEPGQVVQEFNFEAVEGTLLRVRILEPHTERPIRGARVQGSSAGGRLGGYTDANGIFERRVLNGDLRVFFASPPGGAYVIEDEGSRSTQVLADGGVEEVTLYAPSPLHPLVTFTGRLLLPNGAPAAGIKISTANNISRYHTATFVGSGNAYTCTDPDGSFELADVPRDAKVFLYGHTDDYAYVLAEVLDPAAVGPALARPLIMQQGRTASVILTDESGKPRAHADLKIRPRQWEHYVFRADDRPAVTDVEGRLTLNGLVPGLEYFIRDARAVLSQSGWWEYYNENRVLLPMDAGAAAATTSTGGPERAVAEISGIVMDPNGRPIADAYVNIENRDLLLLPQLQKVGARARRVARPEYTRTNTEGHFRFADLAPGKTDVVVWVQGRRTEFVRDVSTGTVGLRVVLGEPRPYRLSGVVVDERCAAIADVELTLVEETLSGPGKGRHEPPMTVHTDERGAFQFVRVFQPTDGQAVRRMLFARKPSYGVWGRALDTTGGETSLRITLAPEEKVCGKVVNETGEPIAGALVSVRSCWGRYGQFAFPAGWQELAPQGISQSDGSFALGQVPTESDVFLHVRAEGYASGEMPHVKTGQFGSYGIQRGQTITFMGSNEEPNTPLEIRLRRAVTLRGTVAYEGTGQPAKAIRVATQAQRGDTWSETVTDEAGRFELNGVDPVPCNLLTLVEDFSETAMPEWTAAAIRFNDLQPGETRDGIQILLTKGEIIRGQVTDAEGHPLKGIDIAFYSAARPRAGAACQSILTADDGTWAYRFPPGQVYIYIRTDISSGSWVRKSYTYNLTAGHTIDNVDFRLNKATPETSSHRSPTVTATSPKGGESALPDGAAPGVLTEWPVAAGGNGHCYQAIRMSRPLSWSEAERIAGALGGHLATITSKPENDFVFGLIDDDRYWFHSYNWRGPWIGGVQPPGSKEPDGNWTWVTGEPFTYAPWDAQQPNNFNGTPENRIAFGNQRDRVSTWNDFTEDFGEIVSLVVEFPRPEPPAARSSARIQRFRVNEGR